MFRPKRPRRANPKAQRGAVTRAKLDLAQLIEQWGTSRSYGGGFAARVAPGADHEVTRLDSPQADQAARRTDPAGCPCAAEIRLAVT